MRGKGNFKANLNLPFLYHKASAIKKWNSAAYASRLCLSTVGQISK